MRPMDRKAARLDGGIVKALCVRQPWAHLLVTGVKPVENRTWGTKYRGPLAIVASAGCTAEEYEIAHAYCGLRRVKLPPLATLKRGGVVGVVRLHNVVRPGEERELTADEARWYGWDVAWCVDDAREVPFVPLKGRLSIFDLPHDIAAKVTR